MATLEQVRSDLTRTLVGWSLASVAGGAALGARQLGPRASGFARQAVAWGAVDLAIAAAGAVGGRKPVRDRSGETASLRRLLLLNAALDVGYVAAGAALVRAGTVRGRDSVGDGAGVVVQGLFLLVLDLGTAARLRTTRV
ncbi:DUF6992 family protein [Jannaschia sp. R86511]|uniref:DUF6992 family protein n=1 Tax=Jannaschia sp. R86511 TaxID=3093853 RepID=UPI0036D380F1